MRASRAAIVRGVVIGGQFCCYKSLQTLLTEVRVAGMVNEAPKTIASFARNRLCARLLSVGLREVIGGQFCCYKSLQTFLTEVRVLSMYWTTTCCNCDTILAQIQVKHTDTRYLFTGQTNRKQGKSVVVWV